MIKNILINRLWINRFFNFKGCSFSKGVKKYLYFEKSKKNISIIKKLKISCKIINKIENISVNFDLIILCTPMSQYSRIILKLNKFITKQTILTDVGSTKEQSFKDG